MNEAERAVANTMVIEAKKDRLGQRQSNDWAVTFVIENGHVPNALNIAAMGQRFLMTLVELDDTSEAKEQPAGATEPPKEKRRSRAQRAGILSNDEMFHAFIRSEHEASAKQVNRQMTGSGFSDANEQVAATVRHLCRVDSRAEFDRDETAGKRWDRLLAEYTAWANPGVVA